MRFLSKTNDENCCYELGSITKMDKVQILSKQLKWLTAMKTWDIK